MATAERNSPTADSNNSCVAGASAEDSSSSTSLDRFLERVKTDLMYELRSIEHGRRPVTGQSHRECLQQFMEKHRMGLKDISQTSEASSSGKENNIPANVDSVEKHRPEAVVVEVQAVVALRPVSSVLQSASFRRHLENIVRGSLTTRQPVNAYAANNLSSSHAGRSSVAASTNVTARTSSGTASSNVTHTLTDTPVLQSAAFRRHLENIVHGSLTNRQPANAAAANNHSSSHAGRSSVANTTNVTARTSSGTASSNVTHTLTDTPVPDVTQTPEIRPQFTRQISTESNDSFSSARSSYEQDIDSDAEEVEDTTLPPEDSASPRSEGFQRAVDPQRQERAINEQQHPSNGNITWNDITRVQREEIVGEISELLHSRLVSSTLGGEFRTVLELVAQNHLSASGTNGRAVQDFVNSLPRTGVQRNDFSHLGFAPPQENDNWDNISITSVSAHSVPYAQTNSHLAREIQSLRSQMNEMKNMLRLTFDLQVDIQRSIRQEVAAAINAVPGATGVSSSVPRPAQPVNDSHCLICLERHTDSVLYQCGHMCVCFACGRDLVSRGHKCPVCRAPIKDVIRAYRTNAE
ncbi:hypothetical protein BsWGS_04434 [Bradybaena similaris]